MIGSHVKWKGQWNGLLGKWTDTRDYPVGPFVLTGLQGYYDTSDTSSLVYDSAGRVSLFMDKSGNSQATCFVSNVAASNSLSAPTKSVTGSQLFTLDIGLDDYTPGSDVTIASKLSGNDGFAIQVLTTGVVRLRIGDGVSVTNVDSTASLSIADMVRGTIGIIWADGLGASFTQNGAALGVPVAAVKTLTNAAVAMTVGTITGRIYRFTALGFYDCNPAGATRGSASFASGGDTWTLATSGATGARISGERDLYQGTVANQPIYLPWSAENYGWLNGVSGNYFSTPDSASISITGDLDIRVRAAAVDWSSVATAQILVSKQGGSTSGEYWFRLTNAGALQILWASAGVLQTASVSTVIVPFADGQTGWVRVTRSATQVIYYTAPDSASVPTVWTQLGATISAVGLLPATDTAEPLQIGCRNSGLTDLFVGTIYRAQVYSGIAGTLAFDFNPAAYTSGTTFLDSSSNAATITINGGAHIVTRTGLYFDGSNDYLKSAAFALSQPETVCFIGEKVTYTNNDTHYDGNASPSMRFANGVSETTDYITSDAVNFRTNTSAPAIHVNAFSTAVFNGANGQLRYNRNPPFTGNVGASAGNGFTLGATAVGGSSANVFVSEVAIYNTALSTASQDALALYEGRKWRFTV